MPLTRAPRLRFSGEALAASGNFVSTGSSPGSSEIAAHRHDWQHPVTRFPNNGIYAIPAT
jgi:hypothetical protein